MESPAPFDLNAAISRWREDLAQSPEYSGNDLDELETHLRDSIETLARNGMPMEAAFASAQQRFGNPSQLAEEFAKAHPGRVLASRLMWLALGLVSIALVGQLARALGSCLDMLACAFAPESMRSAVIIGSLALGYVVALLGYYHLITVRFGFLEAQARWGIGHPLRFAGSMAAACFVGVSLAGVARAGLIRMNTPSTIGGAAIGMQVVAVAFGLAIAMAPVYAIISRRKSMSLADSGRIHIMRLAWLAMAGIVMQVASLAGNLANSCDAFVMSYRFNGYLESRDIRAAVGLLLTLGLNVWILFRLYRVVQSDLKIFGRFEKLALKRPARLLAELGTIWCVLAFCATVINTFLSASIAHNLTTESAVYLNFVGLSLVTPIIKLAFIVWLTLRACRLGREIQENVPRGTI